MSDFAVHREPPAARIVAVGKGAAGHAARTEDDGYVRTRCGITRLAEHVRDVAERTCRLCARWDGYDSIGPTRWNRGIR